MINKQKSYENAANTIIDNLKRRQMEGYYCATAEEAMDKILSLMPEGSSIGWGGSMTLGEIGFYDAIQGKGYDVIDRSLVKTPADQKAVNARLHVANFFFMSTNAITMDGQLVNIDGRGSRLAYLCYGPDNVIVVAGMNKVVADVDSGIKRIRTTAAPANTVRLNRKTPCAVTGHCGNCLSPDCICAQTVITRFSPVPGRIKVILVGQELGY